MKIHIIHQYFKTPHEGGGIRSYYIARHLAQLGHEVSVITAYNEKGYRTQKLGAVTVHYLPVYYTNHLSFLSRIHAFFRFVKQSLGIIKKLGPADLNYVITTPLSTGLIALYAKWRFKTPYFFEVGDLWPDAPIALGVIRSPLLKKLAFQLERNSYKHAEVLIALSPDIQAAIKLKVPDKRIEVVTNIADTTFFTKSEKPREIVNKFGVPGKFVITYSGTVGMANHLEYLLDLADEVKVNERIHFIVAGAGARWEPIKENARKRHLTNITFIEFLDKEGVRELLNISDAVYISFKNTAILSTGSPNKFFDGLAAGKLIITNFKGWIGELIESEQCGFSYAPHKPIECLQMLQPYIDSPSRLQEAQINARSLAKRFTPEVQLQGLTRLVQAFADDRRFR